MLVLCRDLENRSIYLYGPDGLPFEQVTGGTTTYLHHDQIGSTRLVTDSAGATGTATTLTYDPYGNSVSTSGSLTTHMQFSGEYTDTESGLYYLRSRYYDPVTSQFVSVDLLVPVTRSPYAYVLGEPLDNADPRGLDPKRYEGVPSSGYIPFQRVSDKYANQIAKAAGYANAEDMKGLENTGGYDIYVEDNGNVFIASKAAVNAGKCPMEAREYVLDQNGNIANTQTMFQPTPLDPTTNGDEDKVNGDNADGGNPDGEAGGGVQDVGAGGAQVPTSNSLNGWTQHDE